MCPSSLPVIMYPFLSESERWGEGAGGGVGGGGEAMVR